MRPTMSPIFNSGNPLRACGKIMQKERILFSWSGGKDSSFALYEILQSGRYEVAALMTTVNEYYDRVSLHGVRRQLLELQAASIGLPLEKVMLPKDFSNDDYENRMRSTLKKYYELGVRSVAIGDIFLEDLRKHREEKLAQIRMNGIFPLWKRNTKALSLEFVNFGFKAVITCVDGHSLDGSFAGRVYDEKFLADLPGSVDPCGENGEFHSFVFDGPIFNEPVAYKTGETVFRDNRFYFCDLSTTHQPV